jgi:hypothetical protein
VVEIGNVSVAPGTNVIAQLTFWTRAGQPSAFVPLTMSVPQAIKPDGTLYQNVVCDPAQVTIIGASPLITPATVSANGRSMTVYGNPQSNYTVQYTSDLSGAWQPLVSFTQTNLVQTVALPDNSPVAFYRLAQ